MNARKQWNGRPRPKRHRCAKVEVLSNHLPDYHFAQLDAHDSDVLTSLISQGAQRCRGMQQDGRVSCSPCLVDGFNPVFGRIDTQSCTFQKEPGHFQVYWFVVNDQDSGPLIAVANQGFGVDSCRRRKFVPAFLFFRQAVNQKVLPIPGGEYSASHNSDQLYRCLRPRPSLEYLGRRQRFAASLHPAEFINRHLAPNI